jgi:hypothetical protein
MLEEPMSTSRAKSTKTESVENLSIASKSRDNVVALSSARSKIAAEKRAIETEGVQTLDAVIDGRRITLEADTEIVLRCGKSSITLTRSGKIILRGTHVVSRSSGANRVQGAQVRIN